MLCDTEFTFIILFTIFVFSLYLESVVYIFMFKLHRKVSVLDVVVYH